MRTSTGEVALTLVLMVIYITANIDRTLNEAVADKVLQYRADYNNSVMSHGLIIIIQ